MQLRDIICSGIQDLKTQRKKNRISFILIFLSIIVYIGVNSTVNGILKGSYDTVNGHSSRILYVKGEGDARKEYEFLVGKYGDDERIQEIYTGMAYLNGMLWEETMDFLGTPSEEMDFSTCYESVFNYDYMGERRMPEYNEIILPRYIYDKGIYDEYTYANGDKLIGKTLTFINDSYRENETEDLERYQMKVIGTYDNISKKYNGNVIFCNNDFMQEMMNILGDRMYQCYQENGEEWMTKEIAQRDMCVFFFIKEGYNIEEVYNDLNVKISKDMKLHKEDDAVFKLTNMQTEVMSYYYYVISMGNIVSFILLCIAVINILISSINEVKDRRWEFALKRAMGYRKQDIVGIFAVEKVCNVLKALVVSIITLFLYTKLISYYNQNMVEFWKRSWIITIDVGNVVVSMILVVMVALMGVIVAGFSIGNIEVAKTLKAGE